MRSTQEAEGGVIVERFGPFAVELAPLEREGEMHLAVLGWRMFGLRMPYALRPRGEVFETVEEGRFRFHVDLVAPLLGRLVRYRGWLERVS